MDSSSPTLQIEVETRLSGASGWTKSDIKIDANNKTITGFTQQGASIGPIEFDSYMGPDAIKIVESLLSLECLKILIEKIDDFIRR